ncbi:MAG: hypothetical protein K6B54_08210 [Clostridia bacterium]|nr:hypothetical protein [Clostridia bacterium]
MESIKKRRLYKFIALAVSIVIILTTVCGCYKSNFRSKYRSGDGSFSDIVYKMPDFERFNSLCDSIEKDKSNPFMAISINNKFIEIFDIYNDMLAMMAVTNLYTYIDVTNKAYINDYETVDYELTEAGYRIYKIANDLKSAAGGSLVRTNNNLDNIMLKFSSYADRDAHDKVVEINNEINSLEAEYKNLTMTEITIDGEKYEYLSEVPDAAKELTKNGDGTYSWLINSYDIETLADEGYINEETFCQMFNDLYAEERQAYGEILIKLIEARKRLAAELGFENFRQYSFNFFERSYTPEDIDRLKEVIKEYFAPLHDVLNSTFDYGAFEESNEICGKLYENDFFKTVEKVLSGVDSSFKQYIEELEKKERITYKYSPVKMDIDFSEIIPIYDIPFIYLQPNENPGFSDLCAFFHEFGHYYHYVKCPSFGQSADIDSMEVMSLSLELLATKNYGALFDSGELCKNMHNYKLYFTFYNILDSFAMDEFETRIYLENNLTPDKISDIFFDVLWEYGLVSDVSLKDLYMDSWTYVYHLFSEPFYTLSYAISSLAAIQVFLSDNPVKTYNDFCTNSAYYSIRDNAVLCGLCDPISTEYLKDLIEKYTESFY